MSLFCSMTRVAGWCLLKRFLSMQTCFTYTYLKKVLRKAEKHLRRNLFFESCWITDHDILKVMKFNRSLQRMLIVALKLKKSSHNDTKENLHFRQSHWIYNSENRNKKRTHKISNSLYWSRCASQNCWRVLYLNQNL